MDELIVGRGSEAHVVIPSENVSRQHCKFSMRGEILVVTDLRSSNGTYVNGQRLNVLQPVEVAPGSTVTLGRSVPVDLGEIAAALQARQGHGIARQSSCPVQTQPVPAAPLGTPPYPQPQGMSPSDFAREAERGKSYVGKAWVTLLLYWLGVIPGLIMNIVWLSEANRTKKLLGHADGHGCLVWLLVWFLVVTVGIPLLSYTLVAAGLLAALPWAGLF